MEQPVESTERPVKSRGGRPQSKEHMAEIAKKGAETNKMRGAIKAYEKAQKRKELEDKFAMIQAEMDKQKGIKQSAPEPLPQCVPEPVQEQQQLKEKKKTKKIIEVVEEEEETDKDDEEEVVIKRIVKKKPVKKEELIHHSENLIQKSSMEMLKNKLNEDVKKRLMASLFDC